MERISIKGRRERCERRLALNLTNADYERLKVLAKVTESLPAVTARKILVDYLNAHKNEIDEAQKAMTAYQEVLKNLPITHTRNFNQPIEHKIEHQSLSINSQSENQKPA